MTTSSPETARLEAHLEHVRDDIGEMKDAISRMATAINTLTAIETKQAEHGSAISRAFGEIGDVRSRVSALELQQPMYRQTQGIVQKAVELVLVAVLGALLAMVVIKPQEAKQPVTALQQPAGKGTEGQDRGAAK